MNSIRLREGKERSLLRRHPWVFQGSAAKGGADVDETVRIDAAFFARRIDTAVPLRARLPIESDGARLVHGEAAVLARLLPGA